MPQRFQSHRSVSTRRFIPPARHNAKRCSAALPTKLDLSSITFQIADLDGLTLGTTIGNTILIDTNAAGYGWFIDNTPMTDWEYINAAADP